MEVVFINKIIIKKIFFWSVVIIISAIVYLTTLKNGYFNHDENLITIRLCTAYLSHIILLFGVGRILWLLN